MATKVGRKAVQRDDDLPVEFTDWATFNSHCRALYNHPQCDFCGEREACFCSQCVVPSGYEELHKFYCHICHAEHVGLGQGACCPTCRRPWPKDKAH